MTGAGFVPPKYLESLIATINDGAKAAQTGAFLLLFAGLYLAATVISTSDEDLLREATRPLSQIGVAVPVVIAYALAPVVFLFLHVHTLIRYDLLAANLRLFSAEARRALPLAADRARLRALLTNVEFVQILAAEPDTGGRSRLFRLMVWLTIAGIPVLVFLAVQISFLRYQSEGITLLHRACLFADLGALVWFHTRLWRAGLKASHISRWRLVGRLAVNNLLPALLIAANLGWFGVVPPDSKTVRGVPTQRNLILDLILDMTIEERHDYMELQTGSYYDQWFHVEVEKIANLLESFIKQSYESETDSMYTINFQELMAIERVWHLLDHVMCLYIGFGCRYLSLNHRSLISAPGEELSQARKGEAISHDSWARIEPLHLHGRAFRFADFDGSLLPGATLSNADLRGARLKDASLQRARLRSARLQEVHLTGARLQGANLIGGQLQGVNLKYAELQGAYLIEARLAGAKLRGAHLEGALLSETELKAADLRGASLRAQDLSHVNLQAANCSEVKLEGVQFGSVDLQGAELRSAYLHGADLRSATLLGVDLRGARLGGVRSDENTVLALVDLRGVDWSPMSSEQIDEAMKAVDSIPDDNFREESHKRIENAIKIATLQPKAPILKLDGAVLVDDPNDPHWVNVINREHFTTDEAAFDAELALLLAEQSRSDLEIATQLVRRAIRSSERHRALYTDLTKRLLAIDGLDERLSKAERLLLTATTYPKL